MIESSNFIERYNVELNPDVISSKYICILNITVTNNQNFDGYLPTMAFILGNGALEIPINFEVWNAIDKAIDGNVVLKLKPNTSVTLDIPFSSQPLDEAVNPKELNKRLETEIFNLYICDFPIRKAIKVSFKDAIR